MKNHDLIFVVILLSGIILGGITLEKIVKGVCEQYSAALNIAANSTGENK